MVTITDHSLDLVDAVDEATSIRRSLQVLRFNFCGKSEAAPLLDQLEAVTPLTLEGVDKILLKSKSSHAPWFRRQIRESYCWSYVRWFPEGTIFQVTTMVDLEVMDLKNLQRKSMLPAGTHRMTVRLFRIRDEDQHKCYPWLVNDDGWGKHLGSFYDHTWRGGNVTLQQL